ncbi:PREDICTED: uncharacterized protein LOC106814993 [Priapulus caudatus]|uniref:XK-related protein n=1 Tax=Priapulus caudatus TaxID=37621 RepID=A0ABM1ERQ8_PRICU|nr:PREDICTED: uncharacterized protein LOC106814993 [Priapulus caudatus]
MAQEYLPLCDVLFNIVSLASYFCDVVFDLVTVYSLYSSGELVWFGIGLALVTSSVILTQTTSLVWYVRSPVKKEKCDVPCVAAAHAVGCGVLWRYCKLFIPVDMSVAKSEIRDLCTLRLLHGFCEAAPMLLVQLYYVWTHAVTDLNIVSTSLSLFCVCWSLASYGKNMRRKNADAIVMTWMGVMTQFMWRLGTVSARVTALTVYATLYGYWLFLVVALHWISMLLWLLSQNIIFFGEATRAVRRYVVSMGVAVVYVFCFLNLQEGQSRHRMIAFYTIMLVENTLLMAVWWRMKTETDWFHAPALCVVWGGFVVGIFFMVLYYHYFHVSKLRLIYGSALSIVSQRTPTECIACRLSACDKHPAVMQRPLASPQYVNMAGGNADGKATHRPAVNGHVLQRQSCGGGGGDGGNNIQGIFNCRFNPRIKRKKKKPSSFVPPPIPPGMGRMDQPFWIPAKTDNNMGLMQTVLNRGCPAGDDSAATREKRSSLDAELSAAQKRLSHYSDHSNYTIHTHSSSCYHGKAHAAGSREAPARADDSSYSLRMRSPDMPHLDEGIEKMYRSAVDKQRRSGEHANYGSPPSQEFPPRKPGTDEIILTPQVLREYERQLNEDYHNCIYGSVYSEQLSAPYQDRQQQQQQQQQQHKRYSYDGQTQEAVMLRRHQQSASMPRSRTLPKDITNQIHQQPARHRNATRADTFRGRRRSGGGSSDAENDDSRRQAKVTRQQISVKKLNLKDLGETQL